MPYSKRLPIPIRTALIGCIIKLTEQGTPIPPPGNWGNIYSFEYRYRTASVFLLWRYRKEVIMTGIMAWVKLVYTMYDYTKTGFPYGHEDLAHAIRCGHKKIFWYLHELFPSREFELFVIASWILKPMIEEGHSDWFVEYITRFPNGFRCMSPNHQSMLMDSAVVTQDPDVIRELIRSGLYLDVMGENGEYKLVEYKESPMREHTTIYIHFRHRNDSPGVTYKSCQTYPNSVASIAVSMLRALSN